MQCNLFEKQKTVITVNHHLSETLTWEWDDDCQIWPHEFGLVGDGILVPPLTKYVFTFMESLCYTWNNILNEKVKNFSQVYGKMHCILSGPEGSVPSSFWQLFFV